MTPSSNKTSMTIESLLESERQRMVAYAFAIVRNHDEAEDIVQNVSIIALKKLNFADHDNPTGWLLKTTRFEALNHYRKGKKTISGLDPELLVKLEETASTMNFDEDDRSDRLKKCMSKLKDRQRDMLQKRYEYNLKGESLAKALGMGKEAMFKALARTQKALKDCVAKAHG